MNIGIDATNISSGGGLTHIRELLNAADLAVGKDKVFIWACDGTLASLPDKPWLIKVGHNLLNKGLLQRLYWQRKYFEKSLKNNACDVLFVPGANYSGEFSPYISMSQNMLPFEKAERQRFFPSLTHLRYLLLNFTQTRSFKKAAGVLFLTNYARRIITSQKNLGKKETTIVPHGICNEFKQNKCLNRPAGTYRWLYVSIINYYKHQDKLAQAACMLAKEGYDLEVKLVGPSYPKALADLNKLLDNIDPQRKVVKYTEKVPYSELPEIYKQANAFIFPSSCENLPNILLEAMAFSLPIASSDRGPMPEVLKDAGIYFNPEDINDIRKAMKEIMDSESLANALSDKGHKLSSQYTWERCAKETFDFLRMFN